MSAYPPTCSRQGFEAIPQLAYLLSLPAVQSSQNRGYCDICSIQLPQARALQPHSSPLSDNVPGSEPQHWSQDTPSRVEGTRNGERGGARVPEQSTRSTGPSPAHSQAWKRSRCTQQGLSSQARGLRADGRPWQQGKKAHLARSSLLRPI